MAKGKKIKEEVGWKCPECGRLMKLTNTLPEVYQCYNCCLAWMIQPVHERTKEGGC